VLETTGTLATAWTPAPATASTPTKARKAATPVAQVLVV